MYAIQAGKKFLEASTWGVIDPRVQGYSLIAKPCNTFGSKPDAERVLAMVNEYLDKLIAGYELRVAKETERKQKADARVAAYKAQLDECMDKPYREVRDIVSAVERDIARAMDAQRLFNEDCKAIKAILRKHKATKNLLLTVVEIG